MMLTRTRTRTRTKTTCSSRSKTFLVFAVVFLATFATVAGQQQFTLPPDTSDQESTYTSPFQFIRDSLRNVMNRFVDCFGGDSDGDTTDGNDDNDDGDDNTDGGDGDNTNGDGDGDNTDGDGSGSSGGSGTNVPPATSAPSKFSITLDLQGVSDSTHFQNALTKWSQYIVGDIPDHTGGLGGSSSCGAWPSVVDDVYICGVYKYIDGLGGILGSASPRHYRPTEGLPITGEMRFETIDVEQGRIVDLLGVILHEMGHVLGIGSLWTVNGLVDNFDVPCPYKADSAASREYQALSGCTGASIPLEQNLPGSNCVHWAEGCFLTEVMSSAANSELPVSRLTLAGMEDLGYTVDYSQAASYSTADMNPSCVCNNNIRRNLLGDDRDMQSSDFVRSLTDTSSNSNRRKLSTEGRQYATDYGQGILEENKAQISLIGSEFPDIGGDVVYILYLEEETVYSVLVTSDLV